MELTLESSRESGSESANEEASGERLPNRTRRTRGTKHENTEERNENNSDNQPIDGKRVKGKYLLRRIQPVTNRYQPMGKAMLFALKVLNCRYCSFHILFPQMKSKGVEPLLDHDQIIGLRE